MDAISTLGNDKIYYFSEIGTWLGRAYHSWRPRWPIHANNKLAPAGLVRRLQGVCSWHVERPVVERVDTHLSDRRDQLAKRAGKIIRTPMITAKDIAGHQCQHDKANDFLQ